MSIEEFVDEWRDKEIRCVTLPNDAYTYYMNVGDVIDLFVSSKRLHQRVMKQCVEHAYSDHLDLEHGFYVPEDELIKRLLHIANSRKIPKSDVLQFAHDHDVQVVMTPPKRTKRPRALPKEKEELDDSDDEIFEPSDEEEPIDPLRALKLSDERITQRSVIMKNLTEVRRSISASDPELRQRIDLYLDNLFRSMENGTEFPPIYADNSPSVRVTRRIKQLCPHVNEHDIQMKRLEIGEKASDLHREVYGIRPMRVMAWTNRGQRPINRYTEATAPQTLDRIIYEVLGEEEEEEE